MSQYAERLPAAFHPAELVGATVKDIKQQFQVGKKAAKRLLREMARHRVFKSSCGTYQVNIVETTSIDGQNQPLLHLSIKRCDRQPIRDWRVLQSIKSQVLSPEHEAVELFPADSRLVDTANQYHLFALPSTQVRFPFGFEERAVTDEPGGKAVQRPRSEGTADEVSHADLLEDSNWSQLSYEEQRNRLVCAATYIRAIEAAVAGEDIVESCRGLKVASGWRLWFGRA